MRMKISGTGSSLPENIVTNDMIAEMVDTSDEWIQGRTGIEKRHISTGETVVELGTNACLKALENAGKSAEEVELIIVANCSAEVMIPSVSCGVQAAIGATNAVAFDINAACSGFLFAMNTAFSYFKGGFYKNALIVGVEVLSKIVDWTDRGTCILFGDGAGAVCVEAIESEEDNYNFIQKSNGARGGVLTCETRALKNPFVNKEMEQPFVSMDGREIYKFAVCTIPATIDELLEREEVKREEIDYYILHQANLRIINAISKKLEIDMERFPYNVNNVGNMSSASIPVLLDECFKKGMLKEGQKLVMSGFGAGLTYGACIITL